MDILFADANLRKACNEFRLAQSRFGRARAKRLLKRLSELRAAGTLEDIGRLKIGHPHELSGGLAGKLAIDADEQFRIIFEPANEPTPKKADKGLDWSKVTAIRIVGVRDYHG